MRAGYTYIEMLAVMAITVILAVLIVPNLVAQRDSRALWDFKTRLTDLAKEARSKAIESGTTVALYYQDSPKEISEISETADGDRQELRTLEFPNGLDATRFDADTNEASSGQWRLPFFSDGGTAGGGIEFKSGQQTFSFSVSTTDRAPLVADGPLPDLSLDHWPAGGYATKS